MFAGQYFRLAECRIDVRIFLFPVGLKSVTSVWMERLISRWRQIRTVFFVVEGGGVVVKVHGTVLT